MIVEDIRGRLTAEVARALMRLWAASGVPAGEARRRVGAVVSVLRDDAGEIVAAAWVSRATPELLGGRPVWMLYLDTAGAAATELERAAFAALQAAHGRGRDDDPIGVCLALEPVAGAARPLAREDDPPFVYAGRLPDGRDVRVAYFAGATIMPGVPPGPDGPWDMQSVPAPLVFDEQDAVSADDLVGFWVGEDALDEQEARRRVGEVLLVAMTADGRPAGVSTVYLQRSEQLGVAMWHFRLFVGAAHRRGAYGARLALDSRALLEQRYVDGRDRRAPGIVYEIEHEGLKVLHPQAVWAPTGAFIGTGPYGSHVRVHWFPGARVPGAQGSS